MEQQAEPRGARMLRSILLVGSACCVQYLISSASTPTLLAGFACSISLGGLKALQLTSDDAQYSEGVQYSEEDD